MLAGNLPKYDSSVFYFFLEELMTVSMTLMMTDDDKEEKDYTDQKLPTWTYEKQFRRLIKKKKKTL